MKLICSPGDPEYIYPGSVEYCDVIGCSEIASIMGCGYETANDVWMRKTHRKPSPEHKAIFDRGHKMEPIMAEMLKEQYGRELESEQVQYRDPDRPWLVCHVDGLFPAHRPLEHGDESLAGPGVWEAKAPGSRMVEHMTHKGIIEAYLCQGQGAMHVVGMGSGAPVWWSTFGYLDYDLWDLVAIDCKFSRDFQKAMLKILDNFHECILSDTPPEPINPAELPPVPGVSSDLFVPEDEEIIRLSQDLAALMGPLKQAQAEAKATRMRLKELLAEYESIEIPGVIRFTHKYGKPKAPKIDGEGLLEYCEYLIYEHNRLVQILKAHKNQTSERDEITFDRTHWCEPQNPSRSLRTKLIGE